MVDCLQSFDHCYSQDLDFYFAAEEQSYCLAVGNLVVVVEEFVQNLVVEQSSVVEGQSAVEKMAVHLVAADQEDFRAEKRQVEYYLMGGNLNFVGEMDLVIIVVEVEVEKMVKTDLMAV